MRRWHIITKPRFGPQRSNRWRLSCWLASGRLAAIRPKWRGGAVWPSQGCQPQIAQLSADKRSQRGVPPLVAHRQPGEQLPQLDLQEGVLRADSVKHWTWLIENPSRDELSANFNEWVSSVPGNWLDETRVSMLMQSIRADYCAFMYVNGQHLGAPTAQLLNDNFARVQIKKKRHFMHFRGEPWPSKLNAKIMCSYTIQALPATAEA